MKLLKPTGEAIRQAAQTLRSGGLAAFPSETVYGLGADATNAMAVARIFEVKERPHFDPLIVHLADASWLERHVESVPPEASWLAGRFWPGPLTLVLPKRDTIPDIVTAGLPTVAVRVPSHPVAHAMIEQAGVPVAAPSANRFGHISPTTAEAVAEELGDRIDLILDGGATPHGVESTIVAFPPDGPVLLRPGPITCEELANCLGREVTMTNPAPTTPQAPGQLPRHYAPKTPLWLIPLGADILLPKGIRAGLLSFVGTPRPGFAVVEVLCSRGELREGAANLFGGLRRLDAANLDLIVAESVPETGLGLAIMDRLRKASTRK